MSNQKSNLSFGEAQWNSQDLRDEFEKFYRIYKKRPFKKNKGGMGMAHMFYLFFVLRKFNPKLVVENGVWYGASTWLIEKAVPKAKIICLDPNLKKERFVSKNAIYFRRDFDKFNFGKFSPEEVLVLFDDHQNSVNRLRSARRKGFRHLIFDDNQPRNFGDGTMGDFYSIKEALGREGFYPNYSLTIKLKKILWILRYGRSFYLLKKTIKDLEPIKKNKKDQEFLFNVIEIYYEFPPLFMSTEKFPSSKGFYQRSLFVKMPNYIIPEENSYNWICYVGLK